MNEPASKADGCLLSACRICTACVHSQHASCRGVVTCPTDKQTRACRCCTPGSCEVSRSCGCPQTVGRAVTDAKKHAAWHRLVIAQGGPAGAVDVVTLRAARGFKTETLTAETVVDEKARQSGKRASGAQRRAARGDS